MNAAISEMLHCLQSSGNLAGNGTDITVLERQRARLKWQQQQQHQQQQSHEEPHQQSYFNETHFNNLLQLPLTTSQFDQSFINNDSMIRELVNRSIKTDPSLDNGWSEFEKYPVPSSGFGEETPGLSSTGFASNSVELHNFSISRTSSCPPEMGNVLPIMGIAAMTQKKSREVGSSEKMASTVGKESFKKRKADKAQNPKVGGAEDTRDKRIKVDTEEVESKVTHEHKNNNNKETSGDTSKDNSKISEVQKPDYIHVRARRGQATDSHSLAERVRREKISERMKYLQDLVPGCNKITGKAGMLDEIINYVQSLQRQVEFLSMKLATVNPRLEFNIDNVFGKDMFPTCNNIFPTVAMSQEMANCSTYIPFNPVQEMVSSCGLDMVINPPELAAMRRTLSAPISAPETFLDTSCFNQEQPTSTWEPDFQNLYNIEEFHQGRSPTVFPPQSFTGAMEANNLKMEM